MREIIDYIKNDKIVYVDIGARWGIAEPWISFDDFLTVIAFEPDSVECEKLNARAQEGQKQIRYFPIGLSDKRGEATLYLTKSPGCSSMLKPNKKLLIDFPHVERFEIEKEIKLHTETLDSFLDKNSIENIDFVKIDTQGTELNILQGSEKALSGDVLAIEVEVEFSQLYEGQPLFAEVDNYLRNKGFSLFDLNRHRWKRKNVPHNMPCRGQLVFGDALYLKTDLEENIRRLEKGKALKFIFISALLGYYDYGRYINRLLFQNRIVDQIEMKQINEFLYMKPVSYFQKAKHLMKMNYLHIRRFRGIHYSWADSDGFEIELFKNDLKRKIERIENNEIKNGKF